MRLGRLQVSGSEGNGFTPLRSWRGGISEVTFFKPSNSHMSVPKWRRALFFRALKKAPQIRFETVLVFHMKQLQESWKPNLPHENGNAAIIQKYASNWSQLSSDSEWPNNIWYRQCSRKHHFLLFSLATSEVFSLLSNTHYLRLLLLLPALLCCKLHSK